MVISGHIMLDSNIYVEQHLRQIDVIRQVERRTLQSREFNFSLKLLFIHVIQQIRRRTLYFGCVSCGLFYSRHNTTDTKLLFFNGPSRRTDML